MKISDRLILSHIEEELENISKKNDSEKITALKDLVTIWGESRKVDLKISNKFDYGKHGTKAINRLFAKIGFCNLLDSISILDSSSNFAEGDIKTKIDFKGKLNEIIHKRNNIIHEDASISFTTAEIAKYINYMYQFSVQLEKILLKDINKSALH